MAGLALLAFLLGMSIHLPFPGIESADSQTRATLAATLSAAGAALLWRRPVREWPLYVLAAAVTLLFAGSTGLRSRPLEAALLLLALAQVVLSAWLGRRWVGADGQLDSTRRLLLFLSLLALFTELLYASLASLLLHWGAGIAWTESLPRGYVASAAAMLTLLPALLTWGKPASRAVLRQRSTWYLALLAIGCLGLALVPHVPDEVVRAALTLPLCWAAVRSGVAMVAQLNAAIALTMVAMVLAGLGPYVDYGLWTLQVDLIGIAVLSLLLAVAIAERARLAARLDQARRFESLGFLAGGIAHDFNNVLGTIQACAEIASERVAADSPGQNELALLTRATERGRDMTQQILLAARQGDPERARVDLGAVADEVLEMARTLSPAHIRIERYVEAGAGPGAATLWVLANRSQLVRAAQNLVRNAAQAARQVVTVRIGVHEAGAETDARFDVALGEPDPAAGARGWLEVADDGPGIDPAHWPHLFDPFYSTRQSQGGSGLGLAIVAGVASGHGGFVGLRTQAARGSVFRLEVPMFDGKGASMEIGRKDSRC